MSTSGSKHDPPKIYIEKEDKEEVTAVFNDKQDSLRRIEQPICKYRSELKSHKQ